MGRMRRWPIGIAATAAAVTVLAACSSGSTTASTNQSATAGSQLTAAWIYVGSSSDAGWTQQHDLGRLAVQHYFGSKVKTIYKQNAPRDRRQLPSSSSWLTAARR